jgi:hypothetical protein
LTAGLTEGHRVRAESLDRQARGRHAGYPEGAVGAAPRDLSLAPALARPPLGPSGGCYQRERSVQVPRGWLLWRGARRNRGGQSGAVTRPASVALFLGRWFGAPSSAPRVDPRPGGLAPNKPGQVTAPGTRRPRAVTHWGLSASGCDLTFGWIRHVVERWSGRGGPGVGVQVGAPYVMPDRLALRGVLGPSVGEPAWGCGSFPHGELWPRQ